jgi:predicted Fe-Mo cluster-binding NifX family protein
MIGAKMKVAISSSDQAPTGNVDPRFGRCAYFMVFDSETNEWSCGNNEQNMQAVQGAGIQAAQNALNQGANVVISGHIGPKAFHVLQTAGVAVYLAENMSVQAALDAFNANTLPKTEGADVEGHWA